MAKKGLKAGVKVPPITVAQLATATKKTTAGKYIPRYYPHMLSAFVLAYGKLVGADVTIMENHDGVIVLCKAVMRAYMKCLFTKQANYFTATVLIKGKARTRKYVDLASADIVLFRKTTKVKESVWVPPPSIPEGGIVELEEVFEEEEEEGKEKPPGILVNQFTQQIVALYDRYANIDPLRYARYLIGIIEVVKIMNESCSEVGVQQAPALGELADKFQKDIDDILQQMLAQQ